MQYQPSIKTVLPYGFESCEIQTIYYCGTKEEYADVKIQGYSATAVKDARVYYYSEEEPEDTTNYYWHYDENNNIVEW